MEKKARDVHTVLTKIESCAHKVSVAVTHQTRYRKILSKMLTCGCLSSCALQCKMCPCHLGHRQKSSKEGAEDKTKEGPRLPPLLAMADLGVH